MNLQNKSGKKYAPTYLRSINNQLNAMFNHAERYYYKEILQKKQEIWEKAKPMQCKYGQLRNIEDF